MIIDEMVKMLAERKQRLMQQEAMAKDVAKMSITNQITIIETILIFVHKAKKGETTMADLELSLDDQMIPIEDLKTRKAKGGLEDKILELAQKIPNGVGQKVILGKYKPTTIAAKIYHMIESKKLPAHFKPIHQDKVLYLGNTLPKVK